ncbi:unnamed protein product [Caenorhabditis nigoni]
MTPQKAWNFDRIRVNGPGTSMGHFGERNEDEMSRDPTKTVGLLNQGNTCWFNSLTQMLFSIPKFRSVLYHCVPQSWHEQPIKNVQNQFELHADLLIRFRRLFVELHFSEESYVVAGEILTIVDRLSTAKGGPLNTIGSQQDASEMLTLIMQWLGDSISAAIHAHLHPNYTRVEENNMVISHWPKLAAPISDVALPPDYEEEFPPLGGLESSLSAKRETEFKANAPALDSLGSPAAKSDLPQTEEPMDTSEGPQEKPRMENPRGAPEAPEEKTTVDPGTIELVEKIKHDYSQIFQATSHMEKFTDNGELVGDGNTTTHSPVCFNLPVSYGNLHDALEAATFEIREDGDKTVIMRNMYEALPAVFFVSLNRFRFDITGTKVHDKFTFPQEVYMDRYIRKNADLVMPLRAKLADLRSQLSGARERLNGLQQENSALLFEENLKTETPDVEPLSKSKQEEVVKLLESMDHLEQEIREIYEVDELKKESYELKAMIVHVGCINRGHYWMYKLKRTIDGLDEWEKLNDQSATTMDYSQIQKEAFGTGSSWDPSAYVLLYGKKDDTETHLESFEDLPSDLQEYVTEKRDAFRKRVQEYRERQIALLENPQPKIDETPKFSWFIPRNHMQEDQNANIDHDIPEASSGDMLKMINNDEPAAQCSPYRSVDHMQQNENPNREEDELLARRLELFGIPNASQEEIQEKMNVTSLLENPQPTGDETRGTTQMAELRAEELPLIQELSEKFCDTSATQGEVDGMVLAIEENRASQ